MLVGEGFSHPRVFLLLKFFLDFISTYLKGIVPPKNLSSTGIMTSRSQSENLTTRPLSLY